MQKLAPVLVRGCLGDRTGAMRVSESHVSRKLGGIKRAGASAPRPLLFLPLVDERRPY